MAEKGTVSVRILADLSDLKKEIGSIARKPVSLKLNDKDFSQPLGRITGKLGEFDKSLEASNARVIAFGASAGAIMGVQRALRATVTAAIEVEKSLADINVILNAGEKTLARFGDQLFRIAANTGQSFQVVATAATELARQGLSVNETLKRTSDALILTRLSGLDAVSSVESLTAAINSFNKVALTSTEIVNKLANVDAAFAVSSADLAEALRRVGSTAADAGVSFDQLVAAVTSAQQTTARGGAVIGNSFKTIFTRLQRPAVLLQLEQLGIKTKGIGDSARPVIGILTDLAKVYDKLASSQRAQISELVGGVFQINIVKAALSDLGKEYSLYDRALATSVSSTDEAIKRNEELNKTLSALINRTFANLQKVGARIGTGAFAPAIEGVLGLVNKALDDQGGEKGAKSFGGKIAEGIFKGLGDFLSGPGLILGASLMIKMFSRLTVTLADAFKTIAQQNKQTGLKVELERRAFEWLSKNPKILQQIKDKTLSVAQAQEMVMKSIKGETTALNEQFIAVKQIVRALMDAKGLTLGLGLGSAKAGEGTVQTKGVSGGLLPTRQERVMEKRSASALGYAAGGVKADNIKGVGRVVYNSNEDRVQFEGMSSEAIMPPKSSKAGQRYRKGFRQQHGFDPYKATGDMMAGGMVPNFAKSYTAKQIAKWRPELESYIKGGRGARGKMDRGEWYGKQPMKGYKPTKEGEDYPLGQKGTEAFHEQFPKSGEQFFEAIGQAHDKGGSGFVGFDPDDHFSFSTAYKPINLNSKHVKNFFKGKKGEKRDIFEQYVAQKISNTAGMGRASTAKASNAPLDVIEQRGGRITGHEVKWMYNPSGVIQKTMGGISGSMQATPDYYAGKALAFGVQLGKFGIQGKKPFYNTKSEPGRLGNLNIYHAKAGTGLDWANIAPQAATLSKAGAKQRTKVKKAGFASGIVPNFARYVFDKDAYLQKYADKGLLQSRLDETGMGSLKELFDYDVMQAGKKSNLTVINAAAGAGKTSLAMGSKKRGKLAFSSKGISKKDQSVVVRATESITAGKDALLNRMYAPYAKRYLSLLPEGEDIKQGRRSRGETGKYMFGRAAKQTSGAGADFLPQAAVLQDAVGGKHRALTRGSGANQPWKKYGGDMPKVHTRPTAVTTGAFSPFTLGHQALLDKMQKTGMPTAASVAGGKNRKHDIGLSIKRKMQLLQEANPQTATVGGGHLPQIFTAPADMPKMGIKKGDVISSTPEGSLAFLGTDRFNDSKTGKRGIFDLREVKRGANDISATKVRGAIQSGDVGSYSKMLPKNVGDFVTGNLGDIQAMQGMMSQREAKKMGGITSRLSTLWGEMGVPFDPSGKSPVLSSKRKKEFPVQATEIADLNAQKKKAVSHKWRKRVFPHLGGGLVPNFAKDYLKIVTEKLAKGSIQGFNQNQPYLQVLAQNPHLMARYQELKAGATGRRKATSAITAGIDAQVARSYAGKGAKGLFLQNLKEPTVARRTPSVLRHGFDPDVLPGVRNTFMGSLDNRWEKLIRGVAFDTFRTIPPNKLKDLGGVKKLMSGLETRGLTKIPVTMGPVKGRVFEEFINAMSPVVNRKVQETGTESIDLANRKIKRQYQGLFTPGMPGTGAEIRSGSLSEKIARQKFGLAGGLVPNFAANPLQRAYGREVAAGVPTSRIRVGASPRLASGLNPAGLGIYNTLHEPGGLNQGINNARASGLNPKIAGVPNFASMGMPGSIPGMELLASGAIGGAEKADEALGDVAEEVTKTKGAWSKLTAKSRQLEDKFLKMSFVVPMASGQIQAFAGTGTGGMARAGKVLGGLTDGFSIASSFVGVGGPWGLAVGAAVGSFIALDKSLKAMNSNVAELKEKAGRAKEEFTRAGNALGSYADTLQRYQAALRAQTDSSQTIIRLQEKLAETLADIPAAFQNQVLAAKDATAVQENTAKAMKELGRRASQAKFASSLEETTEGERSGLAMSSKRGWFGKAAGLGLTEWDTDIFEEIKGGAKKFASEFRSTLDFKKLSEQIVNKDFFGQGQEASITKLQNQFGVSQDQAFGLKDMTSQDWMMFTESIKMLAINMEIAKKKGDVYSDIIKKNAQAMEDAARAVDILETRFQALIQASLFAGQTFSKQVKIQETLTAKQFEMNRGDLMGDAKRSLDVNRPFMTKEAIAANEFQLKGARRRSRVQASLDKIGTNKGAGNRQAVLDIEKAFNDAIGKQAKREGMKGGKITRHGSRQKDISDFKGLVLDTLRQDPNIRNRDGSQRFSGQVTKRDIDRLERFTMGTGVGKTEELEMDFIKANQRIEAENIKQTNELAKLNQTNRDQLIQERKDYEAQLKQIQIQKDIAAAGGAEGFAAGSGDKIMGDFADAMAGIQFGRGRGSMALMGRGATQAEIAIQQATGGPSGNEQLRNMATRGRSQQLSQMFGMMGIRGQDTGRMASNQMDKLFKPGKGLLAETAKAAEMTRLDPQSVASMATSHKAALSKSEGLLGMISKQMETMSTLTQKTLVEKTAAKLGFEQKKIFQANEINAALLQIDKVEFGKVAANIFKQFEKGDGVIGQETLHDIIDTWADIGGEGEASAVQALFTSIRDAAGTGLAEGESDLLGQLPKTLSGLIDQVGLIAKGSDEGSELKRILTDQLKLSQPEMKTFAAQLQDALGDFVAAKGNVAGEKFGELLKALNANTRAILEQKNVGKADGHIPNFFGGRQREKNMIQASNQYSASQAARATPQRRNINGKPTWLNSEEMVLPNFAGSGKQAVLTPAMAKGFGMANGYIPNFASGTRYTPGSAIDPEEIAGLALAGVGLGGAIIKRKAIGEGVGRVQESAAQSKLWKWRRNPINQGSADFRALRKSLKGTGISGKELNRFNDIRKSLDYVDTRNALVDFPKAAQRDVAQIMSVTESTKLSASGKAERIRKLLKDAEDPSKGIPRNIREAKSIANKAKVQDNILEAAEKRMGIKQADRLDFDPPAKKASGGKGATPKPTPTPKSRSPLAGLGIKRAPARGVVGGVWRDALHGFNIDMENVGAPKVDPKGATAAAAKSANAAAVRKNLRQAGVTKRLAVNRAAGGFAVQGKNLNNALNSLNFEGGKVTLDPGGVKPKVSTPETRLNDAVKGAAKGKLSDAAQDISKAAEQYVRDTFILNAKKTQLAKGKGMSVDQYMKSQKALERMRALENVLNPQVSGLRNFAKGSLKIGATMGIDMLVGYGTEYGIDKIGMDQASAQAFAVRVASNSLATAGGSALIAALAGSTALVPNPATAAALAVAFAAQQTIGAGIDQDAMSHARAEQRLMGYDKYAGLSDEEFKEVYKNEQMSKFMLNIQKSIEDKSVGLTEGEAKYLNEYERHRGVIKAAGSAHTLVKDLWGSSFLKPEDGMLGEWWAGMRGYTEAASAEAGWGPMEKSSAKWLKDQNPERNPLGSKKLIGIQQKIAAFENYRVQANWGSQKSGQAQDIFNTKELREHVLSGGNPKEYLEGSENRRIENDKARVRGELKKGWVPANVKKKDSYMTPEGLMTGDKSKAWRPPRPPLSKELQEAIQPERVGVFSHVRKFEAKRKAKRRSAKMRNLEKRYVELGMGVKYGSNKNLYKDEMRTVAAELAKEKRKDYESSMGFVPKTVDGRSFADIHSSDEIGLMSNKSFLMTLEAAIVDYGGWSSSPEWVKQNYAEQIERHDLEKKGKPWSSLVRAESGLASGFIPNFYYKSLQQLTGRGTHSGTNMGVGWFNNPFHRRTAMQTPGLTGMLNPSGFGFARSWGQTGAYGEGNFAEGMVPSIKASQKRERRASGRSDVYTKYVNTPNFAGYATFNGSERGRERSIVKAHPNPRGAGSTPNFATDFGDIKNSLDNLSGQLIMFMETLRAMGGAQAAPQGSSHQIAMSALNVNVNHSGKLTAQIESIQTQVSLAIERAMKQIAPALWSTIKGPSTA